MCFPVAAQLLSLICMEPRPGWVGQAEGREARGEQWGLKLSEKTAGRVWTWAGPYLKGKMVEVWYALQSEIPIKYR